MVFTVTDLLNIWAQQGVFAYVLPFLMIFGVVFGVLSKTGILGPNKGVQAIIALAIGGMALQFDYVTRFFESLMPYTGMGIGVVLVALILTGLFLDNENKKILNWIWFGVGALVFLVIIFNALSDTAWWTYRGWAFYDSLPMIILGIIVIGLVLMAILIKPAAAAAGHA